jgi:hypothetical protein
MATSISASSIPVAGSHTRLDAASKEVSVEATPRSPVAFRFASFLGALFGPVRIAIHKATAGSDRDRWIDFDGL